jgi:hypothetical protein
MMHQIRRWLFAGGLLCCVLLVPPGAHAQKKRTPEQLNALSGEAMDAARSGKMEKAAEIWTEILDEVPPETQLNIHFNLALALRKLGRLPESWHHVTTYVHKTGRKDKKAGKLLRKIEEGLGKEGYTKSAIVCIPEGAQVLLGKKGSKQRTYPCPLTWWFKPGKHPVGAQKEGYEIKAEQLEIMAHGGAAAYTLKLNKKKTKSRGLLVIEGGGRAVQVFLDGMLEGKVPFRRKLKPGSYDLMVGKPGKMPWKKRITIKAGETLTERPDVAQEIVTKPPEKIPPAVAPTTVTAAPDARRRFKWEPWALIVTGGAVIIGGTVMQVVAYSKNEDLRSEYPQEPESYQQFLENKAGYESAFEGDVKPLRTTSFLLYGLGGAAALAGGIWLLVDNPKENGRAGVAVVPLLAPGGAGATFSWGF